MKIFISYASEHATIAEAISLALLNAKHTVYFAPSRYGPAKEFHESIQRDIARSNLFVFLLSPESIQKGCYALTELRIAQDMWPSPHSYVLPVLIRPTPLDTIPEYLKAITILEPRGDIQAEVLAEVHKRRKSRNKRRLAWTVGAILLTGLLFVLNIILSSIQPEVVSQIAVGESNGSCAVDPQGSGVQKFENGWMLARYGMGSARTGGTSVLYAFIKDEQYKSLKWKRKESQYVQPKLTPDAISDISCPEEYKHKVILGFAKWYCDPSSDLIKELGPPLSVEHRAAVQFQEWSRGLLVVGIPTISNDYERPKDKSKWWEMQLGEMAVLFLQRENETNQGIGEWKKVGSMGMDKESVQCSALWHWIKTHYQDEGGEQVLHKYLKDGICGKVKRLDAYIKPQPVCQFK